MSEIMSRIPRLIRNCRLNETQEMLLMPEGVLRLKGSAVAIVKLCDGKRTVREIIEVLRATYSPAQPVESPMESDGIESDALRFLDTLREKRVIDFA